MSSELPRRAVFLDRDGTLIRDEKYLRDPALVRLLPGVGEGLRRLQEAGYVLVVATNQSGVGRGMYTETEVHRCNDEMCRLLEPYGVKLDGIWYCPAAPVTSDPLAIDHPDRKPAPGMLLQAAARLNLDLRRSWMVGDSPRDVLAGVNAGCERNILVLTGNEVSDLDRWKSQCEIVNNFAEAVAIILRI